MAAEASLRRGPPLPADAPTAFFSYSCEDSEFALRLAEDLKAGGACVRLDQLDIEPCQPTRPVPLLIEAQT